MPHQAICGKKSAVSKEICEEKILYPEYRISGGFSLQLYKYLSILLLRFFYFKHEFVLGF
jgi:hypothetical protein